MPTVLQQRNNLDPETLIAIERSRLQRYLPTDLYEGLDEPQAGGPLLRPFIHLAATHYTITTYLPDLLTRYLLDQQVQSPWLRWIEGSLLFADLSGSTALAERLSALGREGIELVTEFLNTIFETMIQVVQAHNGDLISFGGDALLVFFSSDHHAHTATRAALALQEAMRDYVTTVPNVGSFPMHLHIGVESGQVGFVSVGSPESLHYGVLGTTVNSVATAEGLASLGEVVVGPGTRARLMSDLSGVEVTPGYARITNLHGEAPRCLPPPELGPVYAEPQDAIPALLNDLDQLSAYIPDVLLSRILADPQRPQIEADLRPVTVIFAQVIGLEQLAEQLPAEQAARIIQIYVGAMQEVIEQFGGVVNKLDIADEGSRLVAIFGAPTAYEDHTERAARAALGMRDRLADVNRAIAAAVAGTNMASAEIELRQRIGLNLGTAFAGNVGSPARKEYTVMGDAVNVAARVMSKAAWDEVWCSSMAARAVAARMHCDDRGSMLLKGKAAPLRLFRLRAERDTPDVVVNDMGPLIGRERELTWLLGEIDLAVGGSGRALRIVGEAGVGKSRLAAEFLETARQRGMRLLPAACFSYTAGIPYAAWGEWLKALCGIIAGDDDETRTAKLANRLRDLDPETEEWLPLLGDLVRLDIPENRLTRGLDPQLRQARRFDLLERLLHRAAETTPVLVFFEDLHWADPISIDLWRRITHSVANHQILLVGLHRGSPAFTANSDNANVLELHELSAAESGVLADHLAGALELPATLVQQLITRSSGNPLFLAELLRTVADHRSTHLPDSGMMSLDNLPESLNGLLLSRIDRLDEVSRSMLRVASVIGQRIPFGVLQSIQVADQKTLIRQLARLDSEEMTVLERIEPERVHVFRHALIQEVAYQSMLYARRRELHGRIGEYLERQYADDLDDYYGLLAHHYRLSDRRDKAAEYLLKAGQAARDNYANEEAIQYYRWALEALANEADPRTWEAHDALAEVFESIGRYEEGLEQHAAIIAAPQVTTDIARRAHRKRGSIHEKQGQYALALEELGHAMTIARSGIPDLAPLALARTYCDIALVRQRLGEYDQAIAACEAGLAHMRQTGRSRWDELIEADLHSILGGIYGMRGDYPRCQYHFEHCLRAREAADNLAGVSASHSNLGYLWQLQSEYERALEHYRIADQLARKLPLPYVQMIVGTNAADALISLGRYPEAEQRCREALDLSKQMNAQHTTAQVYNTLGIVYSHQGRYAEALVAYAEAQQLNCALGSVFEEANTIFNTARVYTALGRYAEAASAALQVIERAATIQSQRLKAEGLIAQAEAAIGISDFATAANAAIEAHELAMTIGSKHDSGIAYRLLGQIAVVQRQPFIMHFEESIALLNTINYRFELARTWAEYGQALITSGNHSAGRSYLQQAREAFHTIGAHGELNRLAPKYREEHQPHVATRNRARDWPRSNRFRIPPSPDR
ncbi:MAG: adenylate/guanylate cyclase domain-containing protein [Roseiflexaceae bacterium]|nr:adenylate/guanylate cyclase domain-containing protein [Roseiflexaceae bacterium]